MKDVFTGFHLSIDDPNTDLRLHRLKKFVLKRGICELSEKEKRRSISTKSDEHYGGLSLVTYSQVTCELSEKIKRRSTSTNAIKERRTLWRSQFGHVLLSCEPFSFFYYYGLIFHSVICYGLICRSQCD